jgi:penicillin amidase
MPVPGDGRYEWNGFYGKDVLPSLKNPAQGFFATANEMNLPAGYPAEERKISFEWTDPSRASRIKEVLAADDKVSVTDSMALQTDTVSFQSRRAVALLKGVKAKDRDVTTALGLLTSWDSNEASSSTSAAIYEVWATKHLGRATVAKVSPEKARALIGNGHLEAVITYLESGALNADARNDILIASLTSALGELRERLGPDMKSWSWGKLHKADWTPAIAVLADETTRAQMKVGPQPSPGSASTPRAQTYRASDFVVSAGASVRMVMDVGAWDNSMMINTPGQSGDPKSPHYKDLFPLWNAGEYVPLSFSREAVDRNAERVIKLAPAAR